MQNFTFRYPDVETALGVASELYDVYPKNVLLALNVICDPDGSVVLGAVFGSAYYRVDREEVEAIMLPAEEVTESVRDLIMRALPVKLVFLGDGLAGLQLMFPREDKPPSKLP